MSTDRSNSTARLDALLAKARQHAANAERHEAEETTVRQRKIIDWAACADEIIAKKSEAEAEGWNLTNDEIGRAMQWKGDRSVQIILRWRRGNPGNPEVITSGPWEDSRSPKVRSAAARHSAARRVAREQPEVIMDEWLKDPRAAKRLIRDLQKSLAAVKPREVADPPPPPKKHLFIFLRDHIKMGQHVLFVGTSDNSYYKSYLLEHLGALGKIPEGDVNWDRVETDTVVVTDPPYGQGEPGVPGDDSADHSGVYNLLRPRGGFSFCAFRPPLFFEAENGITNKHVAGKPIHYLAMRTGSAMGQGPGNRLHNVLQAIIYWERKGAGPWIEGRTAVSVLEADEKSRAEMREMRKHHTTPKPVNVMADLIDLVTEPGDFVLDPFTGSGSTLIACERTGRRFIGFEANGMDDPSGKKWFPYAEVAVQRWQEETGQKAVVHRSYADPPTMLFDELKANGRWADRPGSSGMTG